MTEFKSGDVVRDKRRPADAHHMRLGERRKIDKRWTTTCVEPDCTIRDFVADKFIELVEERNERMSVSQRRSRV